MFLPQDSGGVENAKRERPVRGWDGIASAQHGIEQANKLILQAIELAIEL